jgi:hypothetical protein
VRISGFTFCHNAIEGGYPVKEAVMAVHPFADEVVAVDMESTDGTRALLESLPCRVLDSEWGEDNWKLDRGDQVLVKAFRKHLECAGDAIILFEADEVWDWTLLREAVRLVRAGVPDLAVHRLQLSQNFQRCQWYPHTVHRVFPKGGGSYEQNPVKHPAWVPVLGPEHGFVWDVSGCFRDCWAARRRNQGELWGGARALRVAQHFAEPNEYADEAAFLAEPQWEWGRSPFALPKCLERHVGKTRYEP